MVRERRREGGEVQYYVQVPTPWWEGGIGCVLLLALLPGGRRGTSPVIPGCGFDLDDGRSREVDNRKKKNRGGCSIPVRAGPLFLWACEWVRVRVQQWER